MPQSVEEREANKREGVCIRSRGNQLARAVAGIELVTDALSIDDRLVVFNALLRDTLDDMARDERRRGNVPREARCE